MIRGSFGLGTRVCVCVPLQVCTFLTRFGLTNASELGYEARVELALESIADALEAHLDIAAILDVASAHLR